MITILQETTDWEYSNGIYHVNDSDELVGYQAVGNKYAEFKKPMKRFSKARRTFKKIGEREDVNEPRCQILVDIQATEMENSRIPSED